MVKKTNCKEIKINREELFKKYVIEKKSTPKIANEVNSNRETIRKLLHFYKIPIKIPIKETISKEELEKLYINKKMSCNEIAEKFKTNRETIRKLLHFYKIKIQPSSERLKGNKFMLGKKHSEETKIKISLKHKGKKCPFLSEYNKKYKSQQMKERWENPFYRKQQSESMKKNNPMKNPIFRKKVSLSKIGDKNPCKRPEVKEKLRKFRMTQKFPLKNTTIETLLQNELEKRNIQFTPHKTILNITQPDVFIEPNICVYCDGDFWHSNPKFYDRNNLKYKSQINNLKNDEKNNIILKENNYKVFRFWENDILNNVSKCVEEIINN
jgi:G:T-mismatch repair DNA endonuclease (very short patch repair protein)/predicted DNA-binding protein YlxM (UPF0122 family)